MAGSVFEYLAAHNLLALGTASKEGIPHVTPCFYANDGTTFYFSTAADSTTAQNLAENPVAALAVADDPGADWTAARGAQIAGRVTLLSGDAAAAAAALFAERYPFIEAGPAGSPFYRLDPHAVRFLDNSTSGDEEHEALGVKWNRNVVHRVFRHLRPAELDDLTARMSTEQVPAGDTLIEAGTEADRFYVIVDGQAEATNQAGEILSKLGPGSFAGEIAILRGAPRSATVTAVTDLTVVSLSKDDFERVIEGSPELRREFEAITAERLARG